MEEAVKGTALTLEEGEQAKALYASGRSYNFIASELKRSPHTVKKFLMRLDVKSDVAEIKKNMAELFEDVAKRMVVSITDEDIKKLSGYQRVVSAAVCTDKAKMLREEAQESPGKKVMQMLQVVREARKLQEARNLQASGTDVKMLTTSPDSVVSEAAKE